MKKPPTSQNPSCSLTPRRGVAYHSENGVRAAAALVHFGLTVVAVLYGGREHIVTHGVNLQQRSASWSPVNYFLLYESRPALAW